jgi:sugar phosphate isomerase/epimerase
MEAGFDYAEIPAYNLAENLEKVSGLPIEATNLFFPGHFRLFGVDGESAALDHAKVAIEAASQLGVKVMVIGSGRQRSVSIHEQTQGLAWFTRLVTEVQKIAEPHEMRIAPENLNRSETNVGNDLASLAVALAALGVDFTVDTYHVLYECHADGLDLVWSEQLPIAPGHVHIADLPRNLPEIDDQDILRFLKRLKALGYDQRISFEGSPGGHSLKEALDRLRTLWAIA